MFLYNSILSSLFLQLLPYKLYAWSRSIIIALYEMSFKSEYIFPAFHSFLSGSPLPVFLISLCRLEVLSSVLISTPELSLVFSCRALSFMVNSLICVFPHVAEIFGHCPAPALHPSCCLALISLAQHLSCSLSWFLLGSELLIYGGASNPGVIFTSFSLL